MATTLFAGLTETVGAIVGQPTDALNNGSGTIEGVTAVGDAILAHHVPPTRREFPLRPERAPRAAAQSSPAPEPAAPNPAAIDVDTDVTIRLSTPDAWEQIVAARAKLIRAVSFPSQSVTSRYGQLVRNLLDMEEWREWREVHAAVAEFFEYATSPEPAYDATEEYAHGRIGEQICVPAHFVLKNTRPEWTRARTIAATHTGSLRFLETLDALNPVAVALTNWVRMLVCEYRLLVRFVPQTEAERWSDDAPSLGHFEVYYTAMTLAHVYALSISVRALARSSVLVEDMTPLTEQARQMVQQYAGDNRQTFVFALDGTNARTVPDAPRPCAVDADWKVIMTTALPFACTYETANRERIGMWSQMHSGRTIPVVNAVSVPHDMCALDVHFAVHVQSPYLPHQTFPSPIPLSTMPLTNAQEPLCLSMKEFAVVLEESSLAEGTTSTRYTVEETALLNATYQHPGSVCVWASYAIPVATRAPTKTVEFVDVRAHVPEPVLAVFMAQSLKNMAEERAETLDGNPDEDADYRVLMVRAVLFNNVRSECE